MSNFVANFYRFCLLKRLVFGIIVSIYDEPRFDFLLKSYLTVMRDDEEMEFALSGSSGLKADNLLRTEALALLFSFPANS